jgi:hypothetical protein
MKNAASWSTPRRRGLIFGDIPALIPSIIRAFPSRALLCLSAGAKFRLRREERETGRRRLFLG